MFITGTLASDVFFQAYLLDGLARWKEERAVAATTDEQQPCSYNHLLRRAANSLSEEVLGKETVPYTDPRNTQVNFLGWSPFTSKLVKFSNISERLLRSQRQLTWSLKTATMNLRIVKTLLCPLWSRSEPSQSLQTHPRHGSAVCQLPPLNLAPLGLLLRFLRVLRQARCTQPPDPDHISVLITFCCYLCAPSSLIH
ncbi:hypothetical protein OJAV_G00200930 [Oryzias javanicus]|uniref:Uncharacterized protein n=1 Tax=Oryzias javanicus TaxID=123683 RepID=A0A437C8S1_ORYJA|nr:hypothetical protein OJAV_G00200930 [Oryzias javanicus]